MKTSPGSRDPRIVIIGAGVAGITAAYVFTRAGFTNVTILEKGSDVGGVWHWNRYPGLTCDVPSTLYQFGFAPKGPTVWNTGCDSWYFTDGRTIDLWPFDRRRLTAMLAVPDPAHYRITRPARVPETTASTAR